MSAANFPTWLDPTPPLVHNNEVVMRDRFGAPLIIGRISAAELRLCTKCLDLRPVEAFYAGYVHCKACVLGRENATEKLHQLLRRQRCNNSPA